MSVFSENHLLEQVGPTPPKPEKIQIRIGHAPPEESYDKFAFVEITSSGGAQPASFVGLLPADMFNDPGFGYDPIADEVFWMHSAQVVSARISTPIEGHGYAMSSYIGGTSYISEPTKTTGSVKLRIWVPGEAASDFWHRFVGATEGE